jgi:hypothetical protein
VWGGVTWHGDSEGCTGCDAAGVDSGCLGRGGGVKAEALTGTIQNDILKVCGCGDLGTVRSALV